MKQELHDKIQKHGEKLLTIFPNSIESNPVKLCKKLFRIENRANLLALNYCNGDLASDVYERESDAALERVNRILGTDRAWFNGDPRGYALKFNPSRDEDIHRDWGGYGIIAPDLREC